MLHATPVRNVRSILARGILASKSKGKMQTVWVCTPGMFFWAYAHAVKKHNSSLHAVAILEVIIPRSWLKRGGKYRKGLWHTGGRSIPAARISVVNFSNQFHLNR